MTSVQSLACASAICRLIGSVCVELRVFLLLMETGVLQYGRGFTRSVILSVLARDLRLAKRLESV